MMMLLLHAYLYIWRNVAHTAAACQIMQMEEEGGGC